MSSAHERLIGNASVAWPAISIDVSPCRADPATLIPE